MPTIALLVWFLLVLVASSTTNLLNWPTNISVLFLVRTTTWDLHLLDAALLVRYCPQKLVDKFLVYTFSPVF